MEIISRSQERENNNQSVNQSPTTSPNSNGSSSNSNGSVQVPTPPLTPNPLPRSDTNPYPTTFVQADTSTFKQVVQMLTGSSETAQKVSKSDPPPPPSAAKGGAAAAGRIPPIRSTGQKKQGFKLYERRNSVKNGLMINTLLPNLAQQNSNSNSSFSPREPEILSPSILDFPSLVLSPVTPLNEETTMSKSSSSIAAINQHSEEEKAIAEKKFYLHPSPRTTTPRDSQPQLLPLFPVTSPRSSSSST